MRRRRAGTARRSGPWRRPGRPDRGRPPGSGCGRPGVRPGRRTSRRPGEWRRAFSRTLARTRSRRPGSARTRGRPSSNRVRTRSAPTSGGPRRPPRPPRGRGRRRCGEMLPVWMRDMSSRLPMRTSSRSADSSTDSSSWASSSGGERDVRLAQARDRGLDPGQRGAQVVRHRGEERGPRPVVAGQAAGPAGLGDQALPRRAGPRRARRTRRRGAVRRRAGPGPTRTSSVSSSTVCRTRGVGDVGRAAKSPARGHRAVHGSRTVVRETRAAARMPNVVRASLEQRRQRARPRRAGTGRARRGRATRAAPGAPRRARRAARWTTDATAAATTTKTTRANAFCGLWIVSVPFGSVKNQLMTSEDTTAQKIAGQSAADERGRDGEREEQQHLERQLVPAGRGDQRRA